ncbi:MAG: von Willebrand factor type A domain-containing protein [Gammaproteobacteria bacterium]|nr:von Willebrand factor type A domain-containing protein [Gammaproteobacteria bacterium]
MKTNTLVKIASSAALAAMLAACSTTQYEAQTTGSLPEAVSSEKVVVTGSRIKARNEEREYSRVVATADTFTSELPPKFYQRNSNYQIFKAYGVNPTVLTKAEPVSTFSMDADNGSYKLALHMLKHHQLPAKEGIRVEEFVNAMDYKYQSTNDIFGLSAEVMPSPFRPGYHLLHLGVQTKQLSEADRKPLNLVIVADVSGSMRSDNKLQTLKQAMITLVSQLRPEDKIALVTYSDSAEVVIPPTEARNAQYINQLIRQLNSQGSTNAAAGLYIGYELANQMYDADHNNRVILTSDGMANVGSVQPEEILKEIENYKEKGIFLTTVGVGLGMYNDFLLEQLANQGNGNYLYLADQQDIQEAFVDKLTQNIQTVAKDAKIQVEFNPEKVSNYRLLGYENRHLNTQDFLDGKKDGGELGAGHRVTAVYEVKLTSVEEGLGRLKVAYKMPTSEKVLTMEKDIPTSVVRNNILLASSDTRLSAAAAAFAEKLRQTYWSRMYNYQDIDQLLISLPADYQRKSKVQQLSQAIEQAAMLDQRVDPYQDYGPVSTIDIDRVPLLK